MQLYRKFLKGVPDYLARYYWWAYLWRGGIWLFDHQPIINAILFGQYNTLLHKTLAQVERRSGARLLQLTCVYGKLTPALLTASGGEVHLCDVADGQLQLARKKIQVVAARCPLARMNAEQLAYANEAFDQVIVFFLLHEMPAAARLTVYAEMARVVRAGGSLLITEYAPTPHRHLLYRFSPFRWLFAHLEPFLPGFWQEDVASRLDAALHLQGKRLTGLPQVEYVFAGFYRVMRFDIAS